MAGKSVEDPRYVQARRDYEARQEVYRKSARQMLSGVISEGLAPAKMRQRAFSSLWEFSKVRDAIRAEVDTLALAVLKKELDHNSPELGNRIARVARALYLLDLLEEFHRELPDQSASNVAHFWSAVAAVQKVLTEDYFSKSQFHVDRAYFDAEYQLTVCAELCSVQLLYPDDAAAKYQPKVADMAAEATNRLVEADPSLLRCQR